MSRMTLRASGGAFPSRISLRAAADVDSTAPRADNKLMTFVRVLEESAAPFFIDRQGFRKVLVGAILSLMPVVNFFALGWIVSILEARIQGGGDERIPDWNNPGRLFTHGVIFFLVILTWAAIPFLFTSAAFAMLKLGFVFLPPAIITLAIAAMLWLLALYVLPMAMVALLRKGSVLAVFDVADIHARASLVLSHYLQATLLNLVALAALALPATVHTVGYFISAPLVFLVMAYQAAVFGTICRGSAPRA
jgi:hypothetical protein